MQETSRSIIKEKWHLIEDGLHDGHMNMRIDKAIAHACGKGLIPPTLRFYGWSPPAVSIGYSQRPERDIDLNYCEKHGIDIVQRPTGGRAVLHDHELTYSITFQEENQVIPGHLQGSFKVIGESLIRGLAYLGIDAQLVDGRRNRLNRPCNREPACFSSHSPYEILTNGKKIIGSAQRRFKGVILQHGSILIDIDRERLAYIFKVSPAGDRERLISSFYKKMISLNEVNNDTFSYSDVMNAMIRGFKDRLGIEFSSDTIATEDTEVTEKNNKVT